MKMQIHFAAFATLLSAAACDKSVANAAPQPTSVAPAAAATMAIASATVGKPAPDFTLTDLDGKKVSLHEYAGKTVVLEWFNPECPFVNKAHLRGSLKDDAARRMKDGVVWLAINSGGEGKQGFGVEKNVAGKAKFGVTHPILLDPTGTVGHLYGATNTPNMFVIDEKGVLVYRGAIDNSPDAEGESPTGGTLINYVDSALDALAAHREIAVKETKAYGCGVKYE